MSSEKTHRPGGRRDVVVGSVWRSRDPRDKGRLVTVESASVTGFSNDFVVVRSVRRSRLRLSTLLERYDVVDGEQR